jgi:hypothetical protein
MIYIEQSSYNTFVLTLTENATISNPVWLFEFQNEYDTNATPVYWVGTDYSTYPERYNLFYITEGLGGDVQFIKGQYTYSVFESTDPITIDEHTTSSGLRRVEEGRMVVWGEQLNTIYD